MKRTYNYYYIALFFLYKYLKTFFFNISFVFFLLKFSFLSKCTLGAIFKCLAYTYISSWSLSFRSLSCNAFCAFYLLDYIGYLEPDWQRVIDKICHY